MKTISPKTIRPQSIHIPGSKSLSHRMLICAALSSGTSKISNVLESEDILLTIDCLKKMGAVIEKKGVSEYSVTGFSGAPKPYTQKIHLGNSGTSMRLLAGIAALGRTPYILTGDQRMCERPMRELLDSFNQLGIKTSSGSDLMTPPVTICGGERKGGSVKIDCTKSSQYLSSLLMIAPFFENGMEIHLDTPPVSEPYVKLTIDIMKQFNVAAARKTQLLYKVKGTQKYIPGSFHVEPDLSNAGYFWAIGAVTGTMIMVEHINSDSLQGDLKQVDILEKMGCKVVREQDRIGVVGGDLTAVEIDMAGTPDAVPAIAVVASFAKGTTRIFNIGHLREKECDRIDAIVSQLQKIGIQAEQGKDFIKIIGGEHHGATIETFNDHRIAMAFSIPGLMVDGIQIENESCVEKSFPNYWDLFDALSS